MLIRNLIPGLSNIIYETAHGLFEPDTGLVVPKKNNIIIIKEGLFGKEMLLASNIVTTAGDKYYAEAAAQQTPALTFVQLTLSTNAFASPVKATDADDLTVAVATGSGNKAASAGYPKTNDLDADNTGAGTDIVTWLFEYTKTDFDDPTVEGMAIHENAAVFGGASADPLLTAFNRTAFAKTADDTLKVFVNHDFLGA